MTDLTIERARTLHSGELAAYGELPLARRQLALRRKGTGLVRAALKALGHEYNGSSGWWITACATPTGTLGLINIAHGVAVETDVCLEAELIEALTIPDQGEGVKASGAAAWTAPDAGEGHRASAPSGWTQLLVDVRKGAGESEQCELDSVSARVVMWGLQTCYGRPGAPGYTLLDGPMYESKSRQPIQEWPMEWEVRKTIRCIGTTWMDQVARRLSELAGCATEVGAALDAPDSNIHQRVVAAVRATGVYGWHSQGYDAVGAARSSCNSISDFLPQALRECGVSRISAACDISETGGSRYYDLIRAALQRAVLQRLIPVAEALWAQMAPLVPSREDGWDMHQRIQPVLTHLGSEIAKDVLRGVGAGADATDAAIVAAYYANGPVVVDLRVTNREVS